MPHIFVRGGAKKTGLEIVDTATWSGASLTVAVIKIPPLAQPGDYLLAFHAPRLVSAVNPTTPAGWTQHVLQTFGASRLAVYGKEMVDGDTDTNVALGTAASNLVSATVAIRRANLASPLAGTPASNTSAVTTSATSPTMTTTVANALVFRTIWLVNGQNTNPPIATWTGKTKVVEASNGLSGNSISLSVVADLQPLVGAAGTAAITISPASTSGVWATLAVSPST